MNYTTFNQIHTDVHTACHNLSGGEIRQTRGDLVETLVADLWQSLGPDHIARTQMKHTIDFGDIGTLDIGCDVDLYIGNELRGIVECKAYVDKCFLERAIVDFRYLKEATAVPKIVVGLENAIAENTRKILQHVHRDCLDDVFFLVPGKRSSGRPLYKQEFFKPIDESSYDSLVNFFKSI